MVVINPNILLSDYRNHFSVTVMTQKTVVCLKLISRKIKQVDIFDLLTEKELTEIPFKIMDHFEDLFGWTCGVFDPFFETLFARFPRPDCNFYEY